ncbi:P-loop containing nucleoside triphosphate hydrolase protein [Lentithecium fluviatile CBS 122367]|uniref:P-loop containing nucleoside triphosphate hydrolase protein n=1 Tax=Lentithecium fluviatile CBS 122367 TaxID=1168545 RepID=A0A6G1J286_9PLEO|nr:P-loop containing nucleoside triphosphate hydrolase protein [Lentithecium fluviatile CBS 122367]
MNHHQPSKKAKTEASPSATLANRVLKEHFGFDNFRLKQEAAITRLLDGQSAVIVFPTGAGKSICYQVSAVAFRIQNQLLGNRTREQCGITLVISPLITLMKDQVDTLLRRNIKAAVLNSSMSRDAFLLAQDDLRNGRLGLVYCAPGRLNSEGLISSLKAIPGGIRLLAVDEAHCISEWCHSFRTEYLNIARFAHEAHVERVACLMATATPKVTQDICNALDISPEGLFSTTIYRPNSRLLAKSSTKVTDDVENLVAHLQKHRGPTIVYVIVQKGAMALASRLQERGLPAKPYHAGMAAAVRAKTQDDFLASDNVIVIGRAGRDGKPAVCLFYLSTKDLYLRNIFTYGDRPSKMSLRLLLQDIYSSDRRNLRGGDTFVVSLFQQSKAFDISSTMLGIIYAQLELHFKLFRAAGALYTEYKYIPELTNTLYNNSSPDGVAINRTAVSGSKWMHVELDDVSYKWDIPRTDLVRKINEWKERGVIELVKGGVHNKYRLEKPLPATPEELDMIEQLDETVALVDEPPQPPDRTKIEYILREVTARDDPRYLTKTAFGINSPRITQEKIKYIGKNTGTPVFESMNECDFPELLEVVTKECAKAEEV